MRSLGIFTALMVAGIFLVVVPGLSAQTTLRGTVMDDSLSRPIPRATVTLLNPRGGALRRTLTNDAGVFWFPISETGSYTLRAEHIGYRSADTPTLQVATYGVRRNDTLEVAIRLREEAILLAPLEVVVTQRRSPVLDGFYHRLRRGFGEYITRDDVERRGALTVTDLLVTVPGIRQLSSGRGSGRTLTMARALAQSTGSCPIQFYVDGMLMNRSSPGIMISLQDESSGILFPEDDDDFTIDDVVSAADIEGVEIYKGLAGVPAEFLNGQARCGVIAIWTRRR
jgi:hypothetical protein